MVLELQALQEYLEKEGLHVYACLSNITDTDAVFFVKEDN